MTINTVKEAISREQFTATAGQTDFDFNFLIFEDSDLDVFEQVVDGNPVQLTLGVDYTVTGAQNVDGGRVILNVGAAAGTIITIDRAVPIDRTTNFITGGKFEAGSLNREFDKRTVVEQQNDTIIRTRMLLYDTTDPLDIGDTSLPFLQPLQFWQKNGAGNLAAVELEPNQDVNTLRSELASETFSAPGAGIVGYSNPTTGSTTVNDDLNSIHTDVQKRPQHNFLINGTFDIFQRGTSIAVTSDQLTADRWVATADETGVGGAATITQQSFFTGQTDVPDDPNAFLRFDQTIVTSTQSVLIQRIGDVSTLNNQKATYAFWAKADTTRDFKVEFRQNFGTGGSADVTTASQTISITTSWNQFVLTFDIPSTNGKTVGTFPHWLSARIVQDQSVLYTLDVAQAQVVEGEGAVGFEREDPQAVLRKATPYFEIGNAVIQSDVPSPSTFTFGNSITFSERKVFAVPVVSIIQDNSIGLVAPPIIASAFSTQFTVVGTGIVSDPAATTREINIDWTAESDF